MPFPRGALVVALVPLALVVAGCSAVAPMPQKSVEQKAAEEIGQRTGLAPVVRCPGDLESRTGATMKCRLADPNGSKKTYGMTVKVVSLENGVAMLDFVLDEAG